MFGEHYGNWTADKKWLIKYLVTGTVTQQHLFRQESVNEREDRSQVMRAKAACIVQVETGALCSS